MHEFRAGGGEVEVGPIRDEVSAEVHEAEAGDRSEVEQRHSAHLARETDADHRVDGRRVRGAWRAGREDERVAAVLAGPGGVEIEQ